MKEITIHTDKEKLHMKFIHDFISNSYCAKGRTPEKMKQSIENSLNFGVYADGEQIGYARVVSDFTIFAYLMDVFIIEKEQGKGYSKKLMDYIFNHPELKDVENWMLTTADAHGLYEKYGFNKIANPEKIMKRELKNLIEDKA